MVGVHLPLDEVLMRSDRDLLLAYGMLVDRAIEHYNRAYGG